MADTTTEARPRTCVTSVDPYALAAAPQDEEFLADYMPAPELQRIGTALIRERMELRLAGNAATRYMWRRKHGETQGKAILGKCQKMSGVNRAAADADYVVWVAADIVRSREFQNWQLEALVYHELNHIDVEFTDDGDPIFKVRGHDVEMFYSEVEVYGLWRQNLEQAAETFRQMPLFTAGPTQASTWREPSTTISGGSHSVTLTRTRDEITQSYADCEGILFDEAVDRLERAADHPAGCRCDDCRSTGDDEDPIGTDGGDYPAPAPTPESMAEELRSAGIPVKVNDQGDFVGPDGSLYDDKSAGWVAREAAAVRARRSKSDTPAGFANA